MHVSKWLVLATIALSSVLLATPAFSWEFQESKDELTGEVTTMLLKQAEGEVRAGAGMTCNADGTPIVAFVLDTYVGQKKDLRVAYRFDDEEVVEDAWWSVKENAFIAGARAVAFAKKIPAHKKLVFRAYPSHGSSKTLIINLEGISEHFSKMTCLK